MQGSGACWPGSKGLGAEMAKTGSTVRVPGSQGPVGQVSGALGARVPQNSQITIFRKPPGGRLAKAWVSAETAASEVGTWRETKPGYPPYPPLPPPQLPKKRVFTL